MSYESIVITKYADKVWFAKDNTLPGGVAGHFVSGWSGGANNDLITLKSGNGGIVYNEQPWSIYSYVDELDSGNNFTPTSAVDLVTKLTQRDFFEYSSSGGGGATTFLQLLDVLFPNYFGRANQILAVNNGETGITSVTPSFAFQNNIGKRQNIIRSGEMWINNIGMANYINANVTINVTETNTPVILHVQNTLDGVSTIYVYLFFAGKGVWGKTGVPTDQIHFYYVTERRVTPEDVADNPNTEIFNLGTIADGDYVAYANTQGPFNWGDSGDPDDEGNPKTYFFTYITDGVTYFAQFVGTPGVYGVGETPFVEADFVDTTNSDITPTQNLQQTTDIGNTTTNPIINLGGGYQVSRDNTGEEYTDLNGFKTKVGYNTPTAENVQMHQDKSGVLALLDDIPENTSELVNDGDGSSPYVTQVGLDTALTDAIFVGADSEENIDYISAVSAYPVSPVTDTIYLVEESNFEGSATGTSDGVSTTVVLPHGLGVIPSYITVQAKNLLASGFQFITADASNITITYGSAPSAGSPQYWIRYKA